MLKKEQIVSQKYILEGDCGEKIHGCVLSEPDKVVACHYFGGVHFYKISTVC